MRTKLALLIITIAIGACGKIQIQPLNNTRWSNSTVVLRLQDNQYWASGNYNEMLSPWGAQAGTYTGDGSHLSFVPEAPVAQDFSCTYSLAGESLTVDCTGSVPWQGSAHQVLTVEPSQN